MIISIFASIGCQNLGDELILKNEIKLLEEEYGDNTKFIVFTYDKKRPFFIQENIMYKEYFPIGIREKRKIFRNIRNFFTFLNVVLKSDLIVLGGGGIIYDEEKQANKSPLDLWLIRVEFFNFFRKDYIFFRGGINIKNEENLSKVKKIFEKAYKVQVRDKTSFEILKKLGIKSTIEVDPVFYDNGELKIGDGGLTSLVSVISSFKFNKQFVENLFGGFLRQWKGKRVGLALRAGYFVPKSKISDKMEEGIIQEIINYLVEQGAKVILLPHSFHKTDNLANDFMFLSKFILRTENGELGTELIGNGELQEVYDVYRNKEIDFCFAMRLHSIILCQVYQIPFVGISYSTKTDEILKEF